MRVLCLNCNRASKRLSDELQQRNADIVLLQEWISHKKDQSDVAQDLLKNLGEISSTRYLVTASNQSHILLHKSDRILITLHDDSVIINTYFPAGKTNERIDHMQNLSMIIKDLDLNPVLIAGDFNLAPRLEDGWYGDDYSNFTKKSERISFQNLLTNHDLNDVGSEIEWAPTFERQIKGKSSRFRCDIFLVKSELMGSSRLSYDHKFRTQDAMSDHSALILELDL
jgi:endonuclease/exonuclease/phosphatase family metal-dependent hydrolase